MTQDPHIKGLFQKIALHEDQDAYKELFFLMYPRLKQFAFSMLHSQEEAEDLVSDAFIKVWEKRKTLDEVGSPKFYLFTAIRNLCINRLNKRKLQLSVFREQWIVQLGGLYADPEQLLISGEVVRKIQQAVESLPPKCKMIFKLVKEDGLKYREVSSLLSLSIKTVEAQMAIALRRIAQCMHIDMQHAPASAQKKNRFNI